jgi:hypothetical protein
LEVIPYIYTNQLKQNKMKTHKLVYPLAYTSLFTLVIGAILMVGGNHIGDYMVAGGAIVATLLMHKLD